MTDLELLELAAKAAGYEYWVTDGIDGLLVRGEDLLRRPWNPLHDNGDALALAVKLKMALDFTQLLGDVIFVGAFASRVAQDVTEKPGDDPATAARRAIVRAAADIGKAMRPLDVVHQALQDEAQEPKP